MSPGIWDFDYWSGGLWPYMALFLFAFIPSEFWRMISIFIMRGVDPRSEVLEWVRAVSNALLAAVVASIIIAPSGALALVPIHARVGAMALALVVFMIFRRSVFGGVVSGVAATVAAAWYYAA
jgi:branched-subunit amino acid transport protein